MTKYFKKIYPDKRPACGICHDGDAINYNEPTDGRYTIEFINETEYNVLKQQAKNYYENEEKENRIVELKEKIYVRQQIAEDYQDFQDELDVLNGSL